MIQNRQQLMDYYNIKSRMDWTADRLYQREKEAVEKWERDQKFNSHIFDHAEHYKLPGGKIMVIISPYKRSFKEIPFFMEEWEEILPVYHPEARSFMKIYETKQLTAINRKLMKEAKEKLEEKLGGRYKVVKIL